MEKLLPVSFLRSHGEAHQLIEKISRGCFALHTQVTGQGL